MSHAVLSPSSAARWLHCPPSALINSHAGSADTVYTREGTLAHSLCELKARKKFLGLGPKKYANALAQITADELWSQEMDTCAGTYLDALTDIWHGFPEPPYVALEQRVDFSEYVPEGFGTADCIMISGTTLHVVDYKHGQGVEVSAEDNPQMKLYALGALLDYYQLYDIETVRMTIVQPRIKREPDTWETTAGELMLWAEETVKPAADLAAKGEGDFAAGDWCRFCAIRGTCRKRAEAFLELDGFGRKLPPELTDEEVGRALTLGKDLKTWLVDVEKYALGACLDGKEIPGYKAVAGRSVRAWTDQEAAFDAARAAGIPDEMLYERSPVTLAALEKIMGKKPFAETLADFITTPPGKPTLAPDTDKRPAITGRPTAEEDFKEE